MKTWSIIYLFAMSMILIACKETIEKEELLFVRNLAGTYVGTATLVERIEIDGVVTYEDSYTLEDQLVVTEIDKREFHYQIELDTEYDRGTLLYDTEMVLNSFYSFSEGYSSSYGYSYTNKKDWRFDPKKDEVYFKLERLPYEPIPIADPNDPNNTLWELHTRTYILEAKR